MKLKELKKMDPSSLIALIEKLLNIIEDCQAQISFDYNHSISTGDPELKELLGKIQEIQKDYQL